MRIVNENLDADFRDNAFETLADRDREIVLALEDGEEEHGVADEYNVDLDYIEKIRDRILGVLDFSDN